MNKVQENINLITSEMAIAAKKSDRDSSEITLVAVTKSVDEEQTKKVFDCGLRHLAENRPDKLKQKQSYLADESTEIVWHYIGSLQRRKVKEVIPLIDYFHALDRLSLADEIEKRATRVLKCFVQVNVSGEASKHGLPPAEVVAFIKSLSAHQHIQVVGLMTMAPNTEDEEIIRDCFVKLRALRHDIQVLNLAHAPCTELSMGMSQDFKIAIEEGATFIRIGSQLFR